MVSLFARQFFFCVVSRSGIRVDFRFFLQPQLVSQGTQAGHSSRLASRLPGVVRSHDVAVWRMTMTKRLGSRRRSFSREAAHCAVQPRAESASDAGASLGARFRMGRDDLERARAASGASRQVGQRVESSTSFGSFFLEESAARLSSEIAERGPKQSPDSASAQRCPALDEVRFTTAFFLKEYSRVQPRFFLGHGPAALST